MSERILRWRQKYLTIYTNIFSINWLLLITYHHFMLLFLLALRQPDFKF